MGNILNNSVKDHGSVVMSKALTDQEIAKRKDALKKDEEEEDIIEESAKQKYERVTTLIIKLFY